MTNTMTHQQMRQALLDKAAGDGGFRHQLVNEPKVAIKDALGIDLPDSIAVEVHEESATMAHVVLPPSATLSADDLEAVAAGHKRPNLYHEDTPHLHRGDGSTIGGENLTWGP